MLVNTQTPNVLAFPVQFIQGPLAQSAFPQQQTAQPFHQLQQRAQHQIPQPTLQNDSLFLQNLASFIDSSYYSSDDYLMSSAQSKQDAIMQNVNADSDPWSFPLTAGIFLEGMEPTFHTKGDAMPAGRTKYIHSVGATGKVKFIPVSHAGPQYSGIFEGADYGIIRLSTALKSSDRQPMVPGMGLKFLRNGVDSANLVAMYTIGGQPDDWNFFSHQFSNHIPYPGSELPLLALGKKFSSATDMIQTVGLSNFAQYDQAGNFVQNPNFPWRLRFVPRPEVQQAIPATKQPNLGTRFAANLAVYVPENSVLYDVYAIDQPEKLGGQEVLIGSLQLDGRLNTSQWGDQNLYFRHQKMDEDVALRPSWKDHVPLFSLRGKCPAGYQPE